MRHFLDEKRALRRFTLGQRVVVGPAGKDAPVVKRVCVVKNNRSLQRRFYVMVCLVTMLSFTSVLLMVLSPRPLRPDAVSSLFAIDSSDSLDAIYRTDRPVQPGRWKYVYVRHSNTAGGNAFTLAGQHGLGDHFVICNGEGGVDGELQVGHRWNDQQSALPPPGVAWLAPDCVSICMVGDFDTGKPTDAQLRRLRQLLGSLRTRLSIEPDAVYLLQDTPGPAGTGRLFPVASLRE